MKYVLDENLGKLVLKTDQNPKGSDQLRAMDKTILNNIPIGIIICNCNSVSSWGYLPNGYQTDVKFSPQEWSSQPANATSI